MIFSFKSGFFLQEKADYKHTSRIAGFRSQQPDLSFKLSQAQSCMKHKSSILKLTKEIKDFLLSLHDEKLYALSPTNFQLTQITNFPSVEIKYIFILAQYPN